MKQWPDVLRMYRQSVVVLCGVFVILAGLQVAFGSWFPTIALPPSISSITPVSCLVSWPLYSGFDETTNYQVRLDGALYGSSTKGTSQTVKARRPGYSYTLDYVIYHRGVVVGFSSASTVLMCPEAPTGVYASEITSTSFRLSWGEVPTAVEYLIQIDGYPDRTVTAPARQIVLDGFLPGILLNVRVRARNASGYSYDAKPLTVQLLPPAPLQISVSEIGQYSFRLSWLASTGAATYTVFRDNLSIADLASNTLTYVIASCSAGATHTARVQAHNFNGASELSTEARVLMIPATPATPTVSLVSSQSFTISWTPIAWAGGYKIWRDGDWQIGNVSWLTNSATFKKGFDPGNAASITVSAYNKTGDSPQSPPVYVVLTDAASGTPASWTLWLLPVDAYPERWSPGTDLSGLSLYGSRSAAGVLGRLERNYTALIVWNANDPKQHANCSPIFNTLYNEFSRSAVKMVAAYTPRPGSPRLFLVNVDGKVLGVHALFSVAAAREAILQVFGRFLPLQRLAPALLLEQRRFDGMHQPERETR